MRRVYKRREWENIWLRTKRYNASGKVVSGTGGVCYLYFPARPTAAPAQGARGGGCALSCTGTAPGVAGGRSL